MGYFSSCNSHATIKTLRSRGDHSLAESSGNFFQKNAVVVVECPNFVAIYIDFAQHLAVMHDWYDDLGLRVSKTLQVSIIFADIIDNNRFRVFGRVPTQSVPDRDTNVFSCCRTSPCVKYEIITFDQVDPDPGMPWEFRVEDVADAFIEFFRVIARTEEFLESLASVTERRFPRILCHS
jgi:hypothetical protein